MKTEISQILGFNAAEGSSVIPCRACGTVFFGIEHKCPNCGALR